MDDEERTDAGEDREEVQVTPIPRWTNQVAHPTESVFVETGRGEAVEVQAGAPFAETVEHLADQAHYGGYFRVFLNGSEILNPAESPQILEPGMRVVITSYDKVAN